MTKKKAKISKKQPKTQEFQGPHGNDAMLWGDIDSVQDDNWAKEMQKIMGLSSPDKKSPKASLKKKGKKKE